MTIDQAIELLKAGKKEQAEIALRELLNRSPNEYAVLVNYGILQYQNKNLHEAKHLLIHACTVNSSGTEAFTNLGMVLRSMGDLSGSLLCYQKALQLDPTSVITLINIGNLMLEMGKSSDAETFFRMALGHDLDHPAALHGLACAILNQNTRDDKLMEIYSALNHAIQMEELPEYLVTAGRFFLGCRMHDRAREAYARALELSPTNEDALIGLANAQFALSRIEDAVETNIRCGTALSLINAAMHMHYSHSYTKDDFLNVGRFLSSHLTLKHPFFVPSEKPQPKSRLRIGYLSGDFRAHPVGYFLTDVLASHSPDFDVHCLDTFPAEDDISKFIRSLPLTYHAIPKNTVKDSLEYLRAADLDILIDLAGYTEHHRILALAERVAPVQATWLGYFGTTGIEAMDHIIADRFVVPEGEDTYYTERVIRLPDSYLCFSPPIFDVAVEPTCPSARSHPPTFGSFNNRTKITDRCVTVWARILNAVPDSRLLLKQSAFDDEQVRKEMAEKFAAHGIAEDRLLMQKAAPRAELLATYNQLDVALDPFPFGGGTTTAETIWMGVPVVALHGDRWVGRVSESMLNTVGLPDLVAKDEDDYVRIATQLIGNTERRNHLRRTLRAQMLSSPLCDAKRFTHNLEAAYRSMWQARCEEET